MTKSDRLRRRRLGSGAARASRPSALGLQVTLVYTLLAVGLAFGDPGVVEATKDGVTGDVSALRVQITDLASDEGFVVIVLLDSAAQYDAGDRFFRSAEKVPIHDRKASVIFDRVPFGTYAVKVFHDENANGQLDTNIVGFPKEGFGFSNNAMGRFGPPSFEQAAFEVEDASLRIEITAK